MLGRGRNLAVTRAVSKRSAGLRSFWKTLNTEPGAIATALNQRVTLRTESAEQLHPFLSMLIIYTSDTANVDCGRYRSRFCIECPRQSQRSEFDLSTLLPASQKSNNRCAEPSCLRRSISPILYKRCSGQNTANDLALYADAFSMNDTHAAKTL